MKFSKLFKFSKKRLKRNLITLGIVIVIFDILIILFASFYNYNSKLEQSKQINSAEKYAEDIVAKCSAAKNVPLCYETEVPKLGGKISMEESFKVVSHIQRLDASYKYCHVLGHIIARKEIDRKKNNWKDVVRRCPNDICLNGCVHGALQESFSQYSISDAELEALKPELKSLCVESQTATIGIANCYHALGHLTMYTTNGNINKSTALCKELSFKTNAIDFEKVCLDGAFMQVFQPFDPEDLALLNGWKIKKEEYLPFCNQFDTKKRNSCLISGWPLFYNELQNPEGVLDFCSRVDENEKNRCFGIVIYILVTIFNFDAKKMRNFCFKFPKNHSAKCFSHVATKLLDNNYKNMFEAVNLCYNAAPFDSHCFTELEKYTHYMFNNDSKELSYVYQFLPMPWKTRGIGTKN